MRLNDAVSVFLAEWPAEGVPEGTVRSYGQSLAWFVTFASKHGKHALAETLTPSFVRAAILDKMEKAAHQRAPNYKGGEASGAQLVYATHRLARWLLAQGVPVENLDAVVAPRVPQRIQTRLYTNEFEALESVVVHRLLNGTKRVPHRAIARDLALINLLGETGLRAAEVCTMTLYDLNLEQGWVLVRGKGSKERALSIIGSDGPDPARVVRLLSDWIEARADIASARDHQYLWTSMRGTPLTPNELRRVLARLCSEAGLPGNRPPHAFRRYVFTEHYRERPGSIRRLAARMGWSERSHKMISVYTHGVELELAREPMPLLSTRRRDGLNNNVMQPLRFTAEPSVRTVGAGPPRGANGNGPSLPSRRRVDKERTANQTPRGGSAPLE